MARPIEASRIEVIDDATVKLYASKSPGERIELGLDAHRTAKAAAEQGIRNQNSDWSDGQIHDELCRRVFRT